MTAASTPDAAAAKPKKQKRTDKASGSNAKKPRVATPVKKTQSNTLDMWFKAAAPKPAKTEAKSAAAATAAKSDADSQDDASVTTSGESPVAETTDEVTRVTPPVEKKRAVDAVPSSAKKLVQRRIHINDPCRVCEAARTEDTSRCELRCLGCDMTVHKKCYDVQSEDPIDDWHCRRCQFILDKRAEQRAQQQEQTDDGDSKSSSHSDSSTVPTEPITEKDASLLPVHAPLDKTHAYHELHCTSDFATVFQFLKRFRRMGLKISMDATIKNLADALTTSPPNKFLEELHVRLLTNIEATISKNQDWTVSFARFLASANPQPRTAGVDAFIASARTSSSSSSSSSKKDEVVRQTPASLYAALRASERVALLKYVCEAQFDDNDALVERIGDQDGDALREEPGGTDASGRTYWAIEDAPSVLDGTVWVCRCTAAKAMQDSGDDAPSVWETVSDDLASLESLVASLALSTETADLQLWQRFSSGILKSLERRSKKQQASVARLARMPRMLGTSVAGLDLGSYVDDDGFGVRRSTRSRRTVTYHVESEEEEEDDDDDEEEEEADDDAPEDDEDAESDDDGKDGSDDDEQPTKRSRRQTPAKPSAPIGSRRSSRLRGDASPSPSRPSRSAPSSPPRRRSDRHVAATRAARSSARRRRTSSSGSSSSGSGNDSESEEEEEEQEEEIANDSDDNDGADNE